jgi:hypothetical protein
MRTRTTGFSTDLGVVAAVCVLALGLWIALTVIANGRALTPALPGIAPLPENATAQPARTNAPEPPPTAAPANTNDKPPAAPDPAQSGSGTQPAGPGQIDPAQVDPYPPKPKFDEPVDPPITNVKPIRIGEDK